MTLSLTSFLVNLFVKNKDKVSDPKTRSAYGTLSSVVGIVLNLLLSLAKLTIGTLFGSIAITADATNNLSDAGSQIVSFISFTFGACESTLTLEMLKNSLLLVLYAITTPQ